MKKILMVLVLVVLAASTVQAQAPSGTGFYIVPSAVVSVGINNYLRGGAVAGQALYDIGFLAAGIEVKADYDMTFNVFNFPILLILGIGRNFWVGAGYTITAGSPYLVSGTSNVPWQLGALPVPNTYEIGANVFSLPLGVGTLTFPATISYTLNGPVNATDPLSQSLGSLIGFLVALKATIGVGFELKPF